MSGVLQKPEIVFPDQMLLLDAEAVVKRLRYKHINSLVKEGGGLTRGRHFGPAIPGSRRLVYFWDVICADMGLPHSNYGEGDFMTSDEVAAHFGVVVGTITNVWAKNPDLLREGEHFFYVPGSRRKRLFLREAIQRASNAPQGPVVFTTRTTPIAQVRLGPQPVGVAAKAQSTIEAYEYSSEGKNALDVGTDFFYLCAKRFLDEETANCTARLRAEFIDAVSRLLGPYFEGYAVHEITRDHSIEVIQSILHEYGRGRAKICLHVLRGIFEKANQCYGIASPLRESDDELTVLDIGPRPLTAVQCQALLSAAPGEWRPYFATRFFTGLTDREAHALRWQSVDWVSDTLSVEESYERRMWHQLEAGSPRRRSVKMSRIVRDALQVLHRKRPKGLPNTSVFQDRRGDPLPGAANLSELWSTMLKQCRIAGMRTNNLRHTAPYLWLCAGESKEDVARWAGFGEDVDRMMLVYGKLPGVQRENLTGLDRLLLANSTSVVTSV